LNVCARQARDAQAVNERRPGQLCSIKERRGARRRLEQAKPACGKLLRRNPSRSSLRQSFAPILYRGLICGKPGGRQNLSGSLRCTKSNTAIFLFNASKIARLAGGFCARCGPRIALQSGGVWPSQTWAKLFGPEVWILPDELARPESPKLFNRCYFSSLGEG